MEGSEMLKCKYCGKKFGPYNKRTFNEYGEEELWGHIQTCHEEKFEEVQNLETPDMLRTCYRELNPCWGCDCWDPDMGCTMPSIHMSYACHLADESEVLE